jgi:hypothetical protein
VIKEMKMGEGKGVWDTIIGKKTQDNFSYLQTICMDNLKES